MYYRLFKLSNLVRFMVVPTPSEGWGHGETPRRPNSRAMLQGLDRMSKWKKCQRWRAGKAQVRDNLRGGE